MNKTVANNSATDKDLGMNGTIEYTIADGNSEVRDSYWWIYWSVVDLGRRVLRATHYVRS